VTILLVVGVGVVVFGALVLLLIPDRPGGKIAWQGVEVSSIGAGLPLIVVGITAIAIARGGVVGGEDDGAGTGGNGRNRDSGSQANPVLECSEGPVDVPETRIVDVPQGANAVIVAGPADSKTEPFALRFIDDNETVGALTARLLPSQVFQVQSFVDADCQTKQIEGNEPGGAALDLLPNHSNVRIPDLIGRTYILNLGYGGTDIRVNFEGVSPS
jgi:hypothetical protein